MYDTQLILVIATFESVECINNKPLIVICRLHLVNNATKQQNWQ